MLYLAMTRSHFYTGLFFLLPLFYYLSLPIAVGDLAVWVAHGRYTLENGAILYRDIHSVLNTEPLIYPVLVSFIYGVIDSVGGLKLVSLFHKLILVVILYIIYTNSLRKLKNPFSTINIMYVFLAFIGLGLYFIDRPAMVALLPLVISYIIIEKQDRFDLNEFLKLALILIIWVNTHGSWIILIAMLAWKFLFTTDKNNLLKNVSILAGLSSVTLLNPFGYKIWPYLLQTAVISKLRNIDEWNVTNLYDYFPHAIFFYISAALVIFLTIQKIRSEKNYKVLGSPTFLLLIMGFIAMRNVGLLSLVLLPFLYKYNFLRDNKLNDETKKPINFILTLLIAFFCVLQTPYLKKYFGKFLPSKKATIYDSSAPVIFAEYIKSSKNKGPILNDWEYGGYLLYSLKNPILMDARNIIYSQEDFIEYAKVFEGEDSWMAGVNKYKFEFILLDKKIRQKLIKKIIYTGDWKLALENEDTILFQRK